MTALRAKLYKHNKKLEKKVKSWIFDHLTRLSPDDRRTRFFMATNDTFLNAYLDKISKNDEIFLTMDTIGGELRVTGFLHVASMGNGSYEIGVSVDSDQRKQGIARQLFDRAFIHLREVGCKKLYINCLSTNVAMQKIVRHYQMDVKKDEDDPTTSTAYLEMNGQPDFYAMLQGTHQDNIALFDLAIGAIKL